VALAVLNEKIKRTKAKIKRLIVLLYALREMEAKFFAQKKP